MPTRRFIASSSAQILLTTAAVCALTLIYSKAGVARARRQLPSQASVAVLDFGGDAATAQAVNGKLTKLLQEEKTVRLVDAGLARAAARGNGYAGSLNLTLDEARDIGSSIGCDFLFAGRAEVLRRTSSAQPVFYEAYAAIFLVEGRAGGLVLFECPATKAATPQEALRLLLLSLDDYPQRCRVAMLKANEEAIRRRRARRESDLETQRSIIEDAPDDTVNDTPARNLRLPQPYRRLRPPYTEVAARAGVEATVDAAVEVGANGEVGRIEIRRWAGFGLDESVTDTIRRMHFRPAMRDDAAIPMRVLLRYNFRRPEEAK